VAGVAVRHALTGNRSHVEVPQGSHSWWELCPWVGAAVHRRSSTNCNGSVAGGIRDGCENGKGK
jgi:hypothetical protein